jgi:predicted DNA-binding transcriptional regulator YafY
MFEPSTANKAKRLLEMVRLLTTGQYTTKQLAQKLFAFDQDPNNTDQKDKDLENKQRAVQQYLKELKDDQYDIKKLLNDHYTIKQPGHDGLDPLEALALHASTRMLYHQTPHRIYRKALERLLKFIPSSIRETVKLSVQQVETSTREDKAFEFAARAWFAHQQLEFTYETPNESRTFLFDTYFIEVNRTSHAIYLIGFEHNFKHQIITIKANRIREPRILETSYKTPKSFDINQYLHGAVGILGQAEQELMTVTLRFAPEARHRLKEGGYSPTTKLEFCADGTTLATVKAGANKDGMPWEVLSWARQWSASVEILSPPHVRELWLEDAREVIRLYGGANPTTTATIN